MALDTTLLNYIMANDSLSSSRIMKMMMVLLALIIFGQYIITKRASSSLKELYHNIGTLEKGDSVKATKVYKKGKKIRYYG